MLPTERPGDAEIRVMLATDLSHRCDRAQDRAVLLAAGWGVPLTVLHVKPPPDDGSGHRGEAAEEAAIGERLRCESPGCDRVQLDLRVVPGDPASVVPEMASRLGSSILVTGVSRSSEWGPDTLGPTVDAVVRRADVPVLVVKRRPLGSYRRIVVATDFSQSSRRALERAAALFPDAELVPFHAYNVPFDALDTGTGDDFERMAAAEVTEFLRGLDPDLRERVGDRCVLERGSPDLLICSYVEANGVDLVAMGTRGRTGLLHLLLGSTADRLLTTLPCDLLVVPDDRRRRRLRA